jgi:ABC-2 type transport system permease protein
VTLAALWLFVIGLAIFLLGLPPSTEESLRSLCFLIAAIAYGGVWMALAMLFSVAFRSTATAALASLAVWLFFAFFWTMIVKILVQVISPADPYDVAGLISAVETGLGLGRISPNMLFSEAALAFLNPGERGQSLGILLPQQLQGAISGPLPLAESLALVWPQVTGLLAGFILLFTITYIMFQRQEVRA